MLHTLSTCQIQFLTQIQPTTVIHNAILNMCQVSLTGRKYSLDLEIILEHDKALMVIYTRNGSKI